MNPIIEVEEAALRHRFMVNATELAKMLNDLNAATNNHQRLTLGEYKSIINQHVDNKYRLTFGVMDEMFGFEYNDDLGKAFSARVWWVLDETVGMRAKGELNFRKNDEFPEET